MMEAGHWRNGEMNWPVEKIAPVMVNMESERPSLPELPRPEHVVWEAGEERAWRQDDAGRESVELPQLESIGDVLDMSENSADDGEKRDAENSYYSTYEERLKQTPGENSERGEWSGGRGESDFTPNNEEVQDILEQYEKDSIAYEDAIPDFAEVAEATVVIEDMTENRVDNFRQCDEKCAGQWNQEGRGGRTDWTPREVKEWRQENGYSWHERNDMKTCDLVPTKINEYFGHLGGVSECRKRDAEEGGSDFDE